MLGFQALDSTALSPRWKNPAVARLLLRLMTHPDEFAYPGTGKYIPDGVRRFPSRNVDGVVMNMLPLQPERFIHAQTRIHEDGRHVPEQRAAGREIGLLFRMADNPVARLFARQPGNFRDDADLFPLLS